MMQRKDMSPFSVWDSSSAVRAKHALTCNVEDLGDIHGVRWFVLGPGDDLFAYPSIRALSTAVKNVIYLERLVYFLDSMVHTEIEIVNKTASAIAMHRLEMYIPRELALDALKLYTDEGYHAFFTAAACDTLRRKFSLSQRSRLHPRVAAMDRIADAFSTGPQDLVCFMIGFVSETMITKSLADIMRSSANSDIQKLLLAHLEDEFKHAAYFSALFKIVWAKLNAQMKEFCGELLVKIILAYHQPDNEFLDIMLATDELSTNTRSSIIEDMNSHSRLAMKARTLSFNTLEVLRRAGVFQNMKVKALFVQGGLLLE